MNLENIIPKDGPAIQEVQKYINKYTDELCDSVSPLAVSYHSSKTKKEKEAALEQFRTFDRVLDSTIDVQESIMEGGGLSKKDRINARVELRNLKSLKSEYENLITRYERSLGEGEMSIDEELEQFFK